MAIGPAEGKARAWNEVLVKTVLERTEELDTLCLRRVEMGPEVLALPNLCRELSLSISSGSQLTTTSRPFDALPALSRRLLLQSDSHNALLHSHLPNSPLGLPPLFPP